MSSINASADFDRIPKEELARYVAIFGDQVLRTVNGGLDFATNFNAKTISVTFSAADTDVSTGHSLGRVPAGYLVQGISAAMIVYNGSVANSSEAIYLRSSAVGTATVLVY